MGSILKDRYEKANNECVKLANQRFGLMCALKNSLIKLGCTDSDAVKAVEFAKKRDFIGFNTILDSEKNDN